MSLLDRPDFQAWLKRFDARHEQLHGAGRRAPSNRCDGCGEPVVKQVSRTGLCLVCLAEHYGGDRTRMAGLIAAALRVALVRYEGAPAADVRDAVEEVLNDYEREMATGEGL